MKTFTIYPNDTTLPESIIKADSMHTENLCMGHHGFFVFKTADEKPVGFIAMNSVRQISIENGE